MPSIRLNCGSVPQNIEYCERSLIDNWKKNPERTYLPHDVPELEIVGFWERVVFYILHGSVLVIFRDSYEHHRSFTSYSLYILKCLWKYVWGNFIILLSFFFCSFSWLFFFLSSSVMLSLQCLLESLWVTWFLKKNG